MITKEVPNLLVTGRLVSASHEAFASIRVSPICMALGQAAGMAASMFDTPANTFDIDTDVLREKLLITGQELN